eukprot:m.210079 g.210079  ORF g.210079 m.210079 type:complete len:102 (+) comp18553_c0_seq4:359-664(+)
MPLSLCPSFASRLSCLACVFPDPPTANPRPRHQDSKPIGPRVEINLRSGDLYAMSDKAVGHDWLKKSIPTLRHAAGDFEFLLSKMKPEKRPLYRSRPVERH